MHAADYFAITCALVLALLAESDAHRALRASLLVWLGANYRWWSRSELRELFGPGVHRELRRLDRMGRLDRKDDLYRWHVTP